MFKGVKLTILAISLALVGLVSVSARSNQNFSGFNKRDLSNTFKKNHLNMGKVIFLTDTNWNNGSKNTRTFTEYVIEGAKKGSQAWDSNINLGKIKKINELEDILHAIGSGITEATHSKATTMGVSLKNIRVELEANIGLDQLVGRGSSQGIEIEELVTKISISGNANEQTLREIALQGHASSPGRKIAKESIKKEPHPRITVSK